MIEKLKKIGFSEIDAKVYLHLLNHIGENGTQISKKINVSRSAVYSSLEKLEKENIVKIMPTSDDKKNYIPVDPELILSYKEREYFDNFKDLKNDLKNMYEYNTKDYIYNINNEENIYFKIEEIIKNTKRILIVLGKIQNKYINDVIKEYRNSDRIYINFEYNLNEFTLISDNEKAIIINDSKAIYTKNELIINELKRRIQLERERNR